MFLERFRSSPSQEDVGCGVLRVRPTWHRVSPAALQLRLRRTARLGAVLLGAVRRHLPPPRRKRLRGAPGGPNRGRRRGHCRSGRCHGRRRGGSGDWSLWDRRRGRCRSDHCHGRRSAGTTSCCCSAGPSSPMPRALVQLWNPTERDHQAGRLAKFGLRDKQASRIVYREAAALSIRAARFLCAFRCWRQYAMLLAT